jgi:hypothetical protein
MGTNDFLIGIMEKHEKMAWMLRAHIDKAWSYLFYDTTNTIQYSKILYVLRNKFTQINLQIFFNMLEKFY